MISTTHRHNRSMVFMYFDYYFLFSKRSCASSSPIVGIRDSKGISMRLDQMQWVIMPPSSWSSRATTMYRSVAAGGVIQIERIQISAVLGESPFAVSNSILIWLYVWYGQSDVFQWGWFRILYWSFQDHWQGSFHHLHPLCGTSSD